MSSLLPQLTASHSGRHHIPNKKNIMEHFTQ